MPADIVRARLGRERVDAHDEVLLRRLSDEFDVSPHALMVRLTRLDLVSG
jgi:Zn-dependent peptidase ImmA (M78 family)